MNLLIEYFKSKNAERDREYLFCINQNLQNPLINKIFIFISDDSTFENVSEKITIVNQKNRPTFYDLMKYCNLNLDGQRCIIANTDIFFDQTLESLDKYDFTNKFLALTRWDLIDENGQWYAKFYQNLWWNAVKPNGILDTEESIYTSDFSQDSWVFQSPIKLDERTKFLMGKPGCDNRISQIMFENNYVVNNPGKLIKTLHYHKTNYRTYNNTTDMVLGPYLLIKPTDSLIVDSKIKSIPHF